MKPFGASGAWRGVVAAGLHAALLGGLDHDLRTVHVAGDDVAAGVDQRVDGLGLAHRQRPVAGEDDLHDGIRVGLLGAQHERVDVAQHRGDRLGGDEAELVRPGREAGGDAVDVVGLVQVAEIAAQVLRVLFGAPERRGMAEFDLCILFRQIDHKWIKVPEGRTQNDVGAVQVDHGFHRLGAGVGLGDVFLLDRLHAGKRLERLDRDRMGLIPAEIVARTDIYDADGDVGGVRQAASGARGERAGGGRLQECSP